MLSSASNTPGYTFDYSKGEEAEYDTEGALQDFMLIKLKDDPVYVQAMTEPLVPKFSLNTLRYCGRYGRIYKMDGALAEVRFDGNLKRLVAEGCLVPIYDDPCMLEIHEEWKPGQRFLLKPDPLFVHTVTERYNCGFSPVLLKFCGKVGRIERITGAVADVRLDTRDKKRRVPIIALLPVEDDECVPIYPNLHRGMHVQIKPDPLYVQALTSASPTVPLSAGLLDWCGHVGVIQKIDAGHTRADVRFDRNNLWTFPASCLIPVEQPDEDHTRWGTPTHSYLGLPSSKRTSSPYTQPATAQHTHQKTYSSSQASSPRAPSSYRGSPTPQSARGGGYPNPNSSRPNRLYSPH
eukprot:TRINITY_DN104583_c0_g1_i1.p1 TRINITY_DN104583_c0_g1~~TRINITY_DN104583_c0_g1_i1.p1  ORF type:complete len:350 (-),score=9.83 TRINITY_DN104583_c0_g1_i1:154-1203(-)